jgi:uncharacterized protein
MISLKLLRNLVLFVMLLGTGANAFGQPQKFKVLAFYTAKNDQAHISFVHEANKWFMEKGKKNYFNYDYTNDWSRMRGDVIDQYDVLIFLDTRPDSLPYREAFEKYMKNGGAWMGFHFAAFALTPSDFPQDWDWYHEKFIAAGSYVSNTWRPVPAILRVEDRLHPSTKLLPATFKSSASEWYRWSNDLRKNSDIDILLSVDSTSFPLGTGPKQEEIWRGGYYPIAWTNKKYRMVYMNMGHNDIDYEHNSDRELSFTFNNKLQDQFILNSLLWLGQKKK